MTMKNLCDTSPQGVLGYKNVIRSVGDHNEAPGKTNPRFAMKGKSQVQSTSKAGSGKNRQNVQPKGYPMGFGKGSRY